MGFIPNATDFQANKTRCDIFKPELSVFICGNTYSRSIKEDIGKRDTFLTDGIKNTSFNDTAILSLQCLTENQQTYQPKKNTILHSCIF